MTDVLSGGLQSQAVKLFGMSPGLAKIAVPIAIAATGFAVDKLRAKHHYDKGWDAYEVELKDGTAEIDGKIVEIITEADRERIANDAMIEGERLGFQDAQAEFTNTLRGIYDRHSRDLASLASREHTPEEIDWRSVNVPSSTSLRLNRAIAAREADYSQSGLSETGDRNILAGYPPTYSGEPDPDERIP